MSWLAFGALGFLVALLQVSWPFPYLPLDLALMCASFAGLQWGGPAGLCCGGAAGLALDLMVSPHLGLRTAGLTLCGASADALGLGGANVEQPRLRALALGALSLGHDLFLLFAASQLQLNQGGWWRILMQYVLPRLVLHAALALPFFYLFRFLAGAATGRGLGAVVVLKKVPR